MAPIRVLVVGMTSTVGGIENFLMAYCGRIDKSRIRFDFLTRYGDAVYADKRDAIGKTYVIPRRSEGPVQFYQAIYAFFEAHAHEYDVIWDNECMFNDMTPLQLAKDFGIPVRIAHSHNPQNMDVSPRGRAMELLHRTQRRLLGRYANVLWACSEHSARWACPAMDVPSAVIPNAIDVSAFRFDPDVRREVRAHYGLTDNLVVGHVGRMQYQKNQSFLLDAFARLHQREEKARLVLVGDGPDLTDLEAKAVELGIESAVLFLGVRDDVNRLMQAFDLFALPSRFEGMSLCASEAQAAGLPCLLSDTIDRGAAITDNVFFLDADDPDLWAERMLDILEDTTRVRRDTYADICRAGYEINEAAQRLTERIEYLVAETPAFKRRFLLTVKSSAKGVPAMNKARQDVIDIAGDAGFIPVKNWANDTAGGKWYRQLALACRVAGDWGRLFFKLHHGDLLLVQYPCYPVKAAGFIRFALHMIQWKGAVTAALVHDLDSLRLIGGEMAKWSDRELLPAFDRVVAQNERMAHYLHLQGIPREKLITLGMFDYLTDAPMPQRQLSMSVCIAGNLSRKKARYLLDLPHGRVQWHLYGDGWKNKAKADMIYHGALRADELPGKLEGSFGLVWDGPTGRIPTGAYGAYLLVNAPHKMSLYLASGMPVIVWRNAAMAKTVQDAGVGLLVDSLADIPGAIGALSEEEYGRMAANAREMGHALRKGERLRDALLKID